MLTNLLIYSILCYGISNIVVFSHIFDKPREFLYKKSQTNKLFWVKIYELFTCMMCFPTWVGFVLSLFDIILGNSINFTPFNLIIGNNSLSLWFIPLIILLDGCIASGSTWLIHTTQEAIEYKKINIDEKEEEINNLKENLNNIVSTTQINEIETNNILNKMGIPNMDEKFNQLTTIGRIKLIEKQYGKKQS